MARLFGLARLGSRARSITCVSRAKGFRQTKRCLWEVYELKRKSHNLNDIACSAVALAPRCPFSVGGETIRTCYILLWIGFAYSENSVFSPALQSFWLVSLATPGWFGPEAHCVKVSAVQCYVPVLLTCRDNRPKVKKKKKKKKTNWRFWETVNVFGKSLPQNMSYEAAWWW